MKEFANICLVKLRFLSFVETSSSRALNRDSTEVDEPPNNFLQSEITLALC